MFRFHGKISSNPTELRFLVANHGGFVRLVQLFTITALTRMAQKLILIIEMNHQVPRCTVDEQKQ